MTWSPVPRELAGARLALRYRRPVRLDDHADLLRDGLGPFAVLLDHGFVGGDGVAMTVAAGAGSGTVVLALRRSALPLDVVVVALRLLIGMNDADPAEFAGLVRALDGDEEAARQVYGGIDFERDVAELSVVLTGTGPARPVDLWHLGGAPGPIRSAARLVLTGAAARMPSPELEDAVLGVSGLGGFIPVGTDSAAVRFEPGGEEIFTVGDDLVIDRVSMEQRALDALLAMFGVPESSTPVHRD